MKLNIRPKLYPPLALLAALPSPVRNGRQDQALPPRPGDLRRLVATMVD